MGLLGGDAIGACEAVMTVLLNWCGGWAEMFPYPPLSELGRIKALLEFHDSQLADHLLACGAGPDVFAWPMLRSLLSEVLPREDVRPRVCLLKELGVYLRNSVVLQWCQLWDNLITNAYDPSLLLFAVVAFLITNRVALFAVVPSGRCFTMLTLLWNSVCLLSRFSLAQFRSPTRHHGMRLSRFFVYRIL
jgi:hypothetical protein